MALIPNDVFNSEFYETERGEKQGVEFWTIYPLIEFNRPYK
jgi:hypothetical protein